jgi:1,4-dihydroxy-6-naphthoate synthase
MPEVTRNPATPPVFTLGHSPDPDDAFMFYALAAEKIDLRGHKFQHILQDIQTLNDRATRGELHISAISIHAYAYVLDKYALLSCGASMGDGYGPVVISSSPDALPAGVKAGDRAAILAWLKGKRIAIPGKLTSAFLALQIYCANQAFDYVVVPFDEIFDAVRAGRADAGLIIHEGQLTYLRDGFGKIVDLGEWWKAETGLPLPLGGNVIRKDLDPALRHELSEILAESIEYGLKHRAAGVAHAMPLARGMDTPLADQFIGMYVYDYTRDYGDSGRRAIREFLGRAAAMGFIPAPVELEFVG